METCCGHGIVASGLSAGVFVEDFYGRSELALFEDLFYF